jgi:hypothetical protein
VKKLTLKTCNFIDISKQHGDPNNARGFDNSFASDRGCDSTTTTRRIDSDPLHRPRPRLRRTR